jgi:hypothetical protein
MASTIKFPVAGHELSPTLWCNFAGILARYFKIIERPLVYNTVQKKSKNVCMHIFTSPNLLDA